MASGSMVDKFLEVILGLVLLPIGAGFVIVAQADANISGITGMVPLLGLVVIAMGFGLVIKGVKSFKSGK